MPEKKAEDGQNADEAGQSRRKKLKADRTRTKPDKPDKKLKADRTRTEPVKAGFVDPRRAPSNATGW
jgi:hypothetical protein